MLGKFGTSINHTLLLHNQDSITNGDEQENCQGCTMKGSLKGRGLPGRRSAGDQEWQ
jgi:hypothetical protein